jgi:ABC-type multidrug transport system fused ATPase/permease subunit
MAWAAGIATVAALPFAAAGYARQWPTSYRRAMSWLLAVLGILLALGAAGWLVAGRPPLRKQGLIIAAAGAIGLLLAIVGTIRAIRTPVDPAVRVLRALAGVFERQLNNLDEGTGFDRRRFVPLAVGIAPADRSHRTVSLDRALSASSAQVLVLTGESGAGKSVLLRELARETYRR